jgi:hypothetical protein
MTPMVQRSQWQDQANEADLNAWLTAMRIPCARS